MSRFMMVRPEITNSRTEEGRLRADARKLFTILEKKGRIGRSHEPA